MTPVENINMLLTWEQIPVIESARFYHLNSLNAVNGLERTETFRTNLKRDTPWWCVRDEVSLPVSVVDSCIKGWTTEVMESVSRWHGAPWSDNKFWSEAVCTGGRDLTGSWQSYKWHPRKRWVSQVAQLVKNLPAMQETPVWFLGQEIGSAGKESTCNAGDLGSSSGLGRFPGEGQGYPLPWTIVHPWDHEESDMTERLSVSPSGRDGRYCVQREMEMQGVSQGTVT